MRAVYGWSLFLLVASPNVLAAAEPRILLIGMWPNRVRFFDEGAREFVDELPLRNGVVVWDSAGYSRTAHTPGYRRVYFITGSLDTVEVIDLARREIVDEIRLSTAERRVRILGVAPLPDGKHLYLTVRPVDYQPDRLLPDTSADVYRYNVETREVEASFRFPPEVRFSFNPVLVASPDGSSLFVLGADIHEISTETHEVVDTLVLSRGPAPGYGGIGAEPIFLEHGPGVYYAVYQSSEPIQNKPMTGLVRFDAASKKLDRFEVGPEMNVTHVAISPDGKRAYLGGTDLVAVDLENRRVLRHKRDVDRGRSNTSWIVSGDGTRLYSGGVGDTIKIFDTETLELVDRMSLEADACFAPIALPRDIVDRPSQ